MRPHPAKPPRTLALILTAGLLIAVACAPDPVCSACGRQECRNLAATVAWQDGEVSRTCCPRCASYLLQSRGAAAQVSLRDFQSAMELPAERAVLVEGSDVHPCRGVQSSPPRNEQGCCLSHEWDRCEPSVLAFRDRQSAESFAASHGGTLTTWQQVMARAASSTSSSP